MEGAVEGEGVGEGGEEGVEGIGDGQQGEGIEEAEGGGLGLGAGVLPCGRRAVARRGEEGVEAAEVAGYGAGGDTEGFRDFRAGVALPAQVVDAGEAGPQGKGGGVGHGAWGRGESALSGL